MHENPINTIYSVKGIDMNVGVEIMSILYMRVNTIKFRYYAMLEPLLRTSI